MVHASSSTGRFSLCYERHVILFFSKGRLATGQAAEIAELHIYISGRRVAIPASSSLLDGGFETRSIHNRKVVRCRRRLEYHVLSIVEYWWVKRFRGGIWCICDV